MKYLILLLTQFSIPSQATLPAAELQKYATPVQNITCKELDFDSYHKVQNVKGNMLKLNPERTHPNFAGKYLLLKNEFLFDTLWFVADCATGKFISESLSTDHKGPKAEFVPESSLLRISGESPKNTTPPELHVFENNSWMKIESAPPAEASPTINPSATPGNPVPLASTTPVPALNASEGPFTDFPSSVSASCKPLDFNSNDRALSAKKNLITNTPDISHPNFGGHYLLLKGESIFQTYWLLADCNTGKFIADVLTGGGAFHKDSRLFKNYSSGDLATFYVWSEEDGQWVKLHSNNTAYNQTAKTFMKIFAGNKNPSTVRFENVKCFSDHCQVDLGKEKEHPINGDDFAALRALVQLWGKDSTIKSGKCKDTNGKITCDLEN